MSASEHRIPIIVNKFSKEPFDSIYIKLSDLPPQADSLANAKKVQ